MKCPRISVFLQQAWAPRLERAQSGDTRRDTTITRVSLGLKGFKTRIQRFKVRLQGWNLALKIQRLKLSKLAEKGKRDMLKN